MPKSFQNLLDSLPAERRARIRDLTDALDAEMRLQQLRQALGVTQVELARALDVDQAALSKLERQRDVRVSTLRRVLQALGADLALVARFSDREVEITQFTAADDE